MKNLPLNFAVLSHPVNYLTVGLMLAFAAVAYDLVSKHLQSDNQATV